MTSIQIRNTTKIQDDTPNGKLFMEINLLPRADLIFIFIRSTVNNMNKTGAYECKDDVAQSNVNSRVSILSRSLHIHCLQIFYLPGIPYDRSVFIVTV